ncbi:GntR family transcriptional regulator [Rhizobiaceae bacterium]|nr:GntR family transcriptional regulator [Rhizobiaceae bacterium]
MLAAKRVFLAICARNYGKAGLLPTEDVLGEELGVSRTVVREAIKSLSSKTVVETRRRRGTAVLDQSEWNFVDRDLIKWMSEDKSFPDIFERLLDALAFTQPELLSNIERTDANLRALRASAEAIQGSPGDVAVTAMGFHLLVAQLAENPFLLTLTANVARSLRSQHLDRLVDMRFGRRHSNYLDLVSAVERGDVGEARKQMSSILRPLTVLVD